MIVVIWLILLVVGLVITNLVFRDLTNFNEDIEIFIAFFGIWFIAGIVSFISFIFANGLSFGEKLSWGFSLAAICTIAASIRVAKAMEWRALYFFFGIAGISLYIALLLTSSAFGFGVHFNWTALLAFPVTGAIIGLIIEKVQESNRREMQYQAVLKQQEERERDEEERKRDEKERADEQKRNQLKSEIDNLFKW